MYRSWLRSMEKRERWIALIPDGKWIRINNKKYILNGTGSIKHEDLRPGLRVHYNIEKAKGERNGRVTRMWVNDSAD